MAIVNDWILMCTLFLSALCGEKRQAVGAIRHHPECCVLVELSQEGGLREYYRQRILLLHSSIKTRRELCLYPRSVPHRPLKRQRGSHRTTTCQMSRNFANACGTWQSVPCGY